MDHSPREQPETYPGAWPDASILLAGDRHFRLQLQDDRRLSQARILDCSDLLGESRGAGPRLPLSYALVHYNVARVDDRAPVLAVGSNASPAQLRHKYADTGLALVMPLVKAKVEGVVAGVAAEVGWYGSIGATPVLGPGLEDELFVQWLDPYQLALLDRTEGGYERLLLPVGDPSEGGVRITLPSGEVLGACYAYVGTRGYLVEPATARHGSTPLLLPREGRPLTGRPTAHNRQAALVDTLLAGSPRLRDLMGDSTGWFVRIRKDGVIEKVLQIFQDEGWVRSPDALLQLAQDDTTAVMPYNRILPANELAPESWRIVPSADDINRQGQAIVRISTAASETLGDPDHVMVQAAAARTNRDIEGLDGIARVVVDDKAAATFTASGPTGADRLVELDEVLRLGLGVEVGEDVTLTPVQVRYRRWFDYFIGRPFYVTCRVQLGDPAAAEREVCLLEALTLDLMGVASGAMVVVEGRSDDAGEARQIRLKALAVTDTVQQRRDQVLGGDFASRFPSTRDALGVTQDIPWIYLDSAQRSMLGLGRQRLGTVRVRPSRGFQLRQEFREMLVVLSVASIGLITLLNQTWARFGVLAAMVGMVVGVISLGLRGRLMHRIRRPRQQRRRTS